MRRGRRRTILVGMLLMTALLSAQSAPPSAAVLATLHRLVLTDGSFQLVRRVEVKGERVRYISAERGGVWEELPLSLVDWTATLKYEHEHTAQGREESEASADAKAFDEEAVAEKAEQSSRTPEVLPHLRLPNQDGVWALDYFQNSPELVTLAQNSGDVNQPTGHNVLRAAINPLASRKQEVRLDGDRSKVHLHEPQPDLYVSLSGGDDTAADDAATFDTHGAKGTEPVVSSSESQYAIVRLDVRRNYRVMTSVSLGALGRVSQSQDVVPTVKTILPGRHWMKVTPKQPLTTGEYAVVEVLSAKEVNLSVWDFSVSPQSGDNANAILPLRR
jgi:hypothetical protein